MRVLAVSAVPGRPPAASTGRIRPNVRSSGRASTWCGSTYASWTRRAGRFRTSGRTKCEVAEAGATRPLLLFQRVAGAGGSYVELAQRTIASDVSTNQGAPQGQLFVLVFDQDHIRPGGELPVRLAAETFLRTRVKRPGSRGHLRPARTRPRRSRSPRTSRDARQQLDYVRGGLVRLANGAVTEMTESDAYEILRGNEAVITRYTTVSSGRDTSRRQRHGHRPPRDRGSRRAPRRLLRENAQSIVSRADSESRFFLGGLRGSAAQSSAASTAARPCSSSRRGSTATTSAAISRTSRPRRRNRTPSSTRST